MMHVWKNNRLLCCGYTTGSCAAAAAKAAAYMLLTGRTLQRVEITTPSGEIFDTAVDDIEVNKDYVSCSVKKNSGDDPDVTDGLMIKATVKKISAAKLGSERIIIDGGEGVGRVTKKGLEQPVGEAAINSVPRGMIKKEVGKLLDMYAGDMPVSVVISVPGGEEAAKRTFNKRLGIEGGISILGTSGIVVPMSESALVDTIKLDIKLAKESGRDYIISVPGNYGERYCADTYNIAADDIILCSNYVGDTIDAAAQYGIKGLLLAGHIGKFIKLAAGIMNTHSSMADARMETAAAHVIKAGGDIKTARDILGCITTDEVIDMIKEKGMLEPVMQSITESAAQYVTRRAPDSMETGIIIYSNTWGLLGKSKNADILLEHILSGGR